MLRLLRNGAWLACLWLLLAGTASQGAEQPIYQIEPLTLKRGEVSLAGELWIPRSCRERCPTAIFFSRAGPQTRRGEAGRFHFVQLLQSRFLRQGYLVAGFDDRGSGQSGGEPWQLTPAQLADEAEAIVELVSRQPHVDPDRISLVGHGEGANLAALCARQGTRVHSLVLLAPPAVDGEHLLRSREALALKTMGVTGAAAQQRLALVEDLIHAAKTDRGWRAVWTEAFRQRRAALDLLPVQTQQAIGDLDLLASSYADRQLDWAESPWLHAQLGFDGAKTLQQLSRPTLILYAEKDHEVPLAENLSAARAATADNPLVHLQVIKEANHLFQKARSGLPGEYNQLPLIFSADFQQALTSFIQP
jgi:hypothetical protein